MANYYWRHKTEADGLKKLEIWTLRKYGYLENNTYYKGGTLTWSNNQGEETGSISISSRITDEGQYIQLNYVTTDNYTGENTDYKYKIPLIETRCNFDGYRYWFKCPLYKSGVYCGRRVGVLYKAGGYFGCRHCYDLTYYSRNRSSISRSFPYNYLDREFKLEALYKRLKRRTWAGRPTRIMRRIISLERMNNNSRARVDEMGTFIF